MTTVITIVSIVWIISEIALARIKHSHTSSHRLDRSSLKLLWATIIIATVIGNVIVFSGVGTISIGGYPVIICGLALIYCRCINNKRT
jgi:hypothetical protein